MVSVLFSLPFNKCLLHILDYFKVILRILEQMPVCKYQSHSQLYKTAVKILSELDKLKV